MVCRSLAFAVLSVLLLLGAVSPAKAAPRPDLWSRWESHDPGSAEKVDHEPWREFLGKYLVTDQPDGIHRVRYRDVEPADRQILDAYLDALQKVVVSRLNRREQMAYWINFYNALTVRVILDNYPVKSIREVAISPGFFTRGPWDAKLVKVEGEEISLNDMEHRILRPIWNDNRVHYAVNCASLGCPNLQPEPFTAEKLDAELDKAARDFINHPRGVRMDGMNLVLSSIYDWFHVDFGGSDAELLMHLRKFAAGSLAKSLEGFRGGISYDYDWNLNE